VERMADGAFAKLVQQRAHVAGGSKLHLLHDDSEIGEPELRQRLPETLSDERGDLHKLLVSRLLHEAECAAVLLLAGMEREGEAQHRAVRSPEERTLEVIGEFVLQRAVVTEALYFALEDGRQWVFHPVSRTQRLLKASGLLVIVIGSSHGASASCVPSAPSLAAP
jgi:hypothetical protein